MYSFGSGLACYEYSLPYSGPDYIMREELYVFTLLAASIFICFTACHSRGWGQVRYLWRSATFGFLWIFLNIPIYYRQYHDKEQSQALVYWYYHAVCYLSACAINATKFPERLLPGYFDWLCNSHQIFHVATSLGSWYQMLGLLEDIRHRDHIRSDIPATRTVIYMAVSVVTSALSVLWFERPGAPPIKGS